VAEARAVAAAVDRVRCLVVVLGDQLDRQSAAFDDFDPALDRVWMAEASEESTHVWSSQQRIVLFLSAMRHFAQGLRAEGLPLEYHRLDDEGEVTTLAGHLRASLARLQPERIRLVEPGDWRVQQALLTVAAAGSTPIELLPDRHFFCSRAEFAAHARGRKQLRMEFFYREMRRRHRVLMNRSANDEPEGGQWNYDAENRESFGARGPGFVPEPHRVPPDAITRAVMQLVQQRLGDHPGQAQRFAWPVTRDEALVALQRFIDERLEHFGRWQDAMWGGQPWLYHAHIASALNLKLLDPREVVAAAEGAYRDGRVPLAAAEGFIRQVLGWREYVRGIYHLKMPQYGALNELAAHEALPAWYWTGQTPMRCLADAITQTLEHGYAHHIQRLMVTGLYALLLGVEPQQVHGWYLSVYVDAVEWVELPNTLGMSQYADGGIMASKPYVATGQYIERMSDHCRGCRFDPGRRTGDTACPFTTLYWDFLARHEKRLAKNPRMALQVKNLARIDGEERRTIAARAESIRRGELDG
jgi:deoxyribodipyrimidine photolyase-related protein